MPTLLMSEEEFIETYDERDKRNLLFCCICESEGLDKEDCYANCVMQNIIVPSCNNKRHSICLECLQKISNVEVTKKNSAGYHFRRLPCQYPYHKTTCHGKIKKKHWKNALSRQVLDRNNSFYVQPNRRQQPHSVGSLFFIKCSVCKKEQSTLDSPEATWICNGCSRISCGRCNQTTCDLFSECSSKQQWELPEGYSRHFTQKLTNGEIIPLRRNLVTIKMINDKIYQAKQNADLATVHCPTCAAKIYKTSACNDLKHCGNMHVCNFCQEQSFPWEILGLPLEHWYVCNRWDYENDHFPCKENECFNDEHDCKNKNHALKISQFNTQKYLAFESSIIRDTKAVHTL
jgi:hypothetical protein